MSKLGDKQRESRRRIIDSAIKEFGSLSYVEASMNSICKTGNISKGIIYHYFKDKDELYLVCLKESIEAIKEHINSLELSFTNFEDYLIQYIHIRQQYLFENTHYANIILNSIMQPPTHLTEEIYQIKRYFDEYERQLFSSAIGRLTLREDVKVEDATDLLLRILASFNSEIKDVNRENLDIDKFFKQRKEQLRKIIRMVLYGIAEGEKGGNND